MTNIRAKLPDQDAIYSDKSRLVAAGVVIGDQAEALIGVPVQKSAQNPESLSDPTTKHAGAGGFAVKKRAGHGFSSDCHKSFTKYG